MNRFINKVKGVTLAASICIAALGWSGSAYAAGTAVSTSLASTATVDYEVGAVAQSQITAASGAFVVDRKVNMTLTATSIDVIPNSNDQVSTFVLTNTGNASQGFSLTTDITNASSIISDYAIYIDNGNGVWNGTGTETLYATSTGTTTDFTSTFSIGDLAADANRRIYILVDVPNSATNGQTATIALKATALQTGSTINVAGTTQTSDSGIANVAGTVQTVFADAGVGADATDIATDGEISVLLTYTVGSAGLAGNVTKTITVVDESSAGGACTVAAPVANAKAIPGACLDIEIELDNSAGSVDATNVDLTDPVNANLTFTGEHADSDCTAMGGTFVDDTGGSGNITCSNMTIPDTVTAIIKYRVTVD